jgi:hypothetical protein
MGLGGPFCLFRDPSGSLSRLSERAGKAAQCQAEAVRTA